MSDSIEELVRSFPGWADAELTVTPITTGITNRNYRVDVGGAAYVVRVPGERTSLLGIDRAGEAEMATRAAAMGIGPAVLGELPGVGTLVTSFVPGEPADDDSIRAAIERVAVAIRRLHRSGPLRARFPIFRVVEWHARDAAASGVDLPAVFGELHRAAAAMEAVFPPAELAATPCHNDLLPANVLIADERLWVIDYEYAGMNHALFDLANLSVNCGFDEAGDERMVRTYGVAVSSSTMARLRLMKVMSELREGMWAVVQQAISTLTTVDFVAYADQRLTHCAELVAAPDFGAALVAARG